MNQNGWKQPEGKGTEELPMKKKLSDVELETYARQIVLEEIGYDGQVKIRNAGAAIIGMGGLGSLIAQKLVGMGIGHLRMVDRDIVSRSDLHRQNLYDADSLGRPKVEVALEKLGRLNPDVTLEAIPESLNSINVNELIGGMDVVMDGLDQPEPRYLVNRTCNKLKIPYIFGAAIQTLGNVSTLVPGRTLCLECFMGGLKENDLPKCGVVGVHPSILGIVTSIQVFEAVNLIVNREPKLLNKLLYIDLGDFKFHTLELTQREDCPVCGVNPSELPKPVTEKFFEETCARDGRRNFIISPRKRIEIPLDQVAGLLNEKGFFVRSSGAFGLTFDQAEDITVSILKSGIMIAQAAPGVKSDVKESVLETYRSILVDGLGLSGKIVPER
ncbi:MAG TPA: HesA/MoeB/ThiF family protein [Proteobacteria bacterium]|nr:HesA/MoeB/ThiF family protein [Pseudomonadota bacterium]